jgi:hypothetical protein
MGAVSLKALSEFFRKVHLTVGRTKILFPDQEHKRKTAPNRSPYKGCVGLIHLHRTDAWLGRSRDPAKPSRGRTSRGSLEAAPAHGPPRARATVPARQDANPVASANCLGGPTNLNPRGHASALSPRTMWHLPCTSGWSAEGVALLTRPASTAARWFRLRPYTTILGSRP